MGEIIPVICIVVPCYNEEEVICDSIDKLTQKLRTLISDNIVSAQSRIIFVNDGSSDDTVSIIIRERKENKFIDLISLSRNYGHQNAILAGMMAAKSICDAVITIDADLQQDIEAIDEFIEKFNAGNEIIYGIRNDRKADKFFKKTTAQLYYKFMKVLGCEIKSNSADYRLLSKKALEALSQFDESNLFLRGLIPMMGFKSDVVYFDVKERIAGNSKYTLKKMMTLALDGITSFTIKPIRMISLVGFLMCIFSLGMIVFSLITYFSVGAVPGYSTTVVSMWLIGGVIMLSQGIIGEYIGKMYFETKKRPRYIIDFSLISENMDNQDSK